MDGIQGNHAGDIDFNPDSSSAVPPLGDRFNIGLGLLSSAGGDNHNISASSKFSTVSCRFHVLRFSLDEADCCFSVEECSAVDESPMDGGLLEDKAIK